MAGINLSQSMEEKIGKEEKKEKFFDTGFVISLILFFVVVLGWGGLRYYLSLLNKQIVALDSAIAEHTQELEGPAVARIADLDMRMSFIAEKSADVSDPNAILTKLESLMVPSVTLLQYEYNKQDGLVTFKGRTDNFKYIAEQIISLKSTGDFADVKVDTTTRDKNGGIIFTLKAHF